MTSVVSSDSRKTCHLSPKAASKKSRQPTLPVKKKQISQLKQNGEVILKDKKEVNEQLKRPTRKPVTEITCSQSINREVRSNGEKGKEARKTSSYTSDKDNKTLGDHGKEKSPAKTEKSLQIVIQTKEKVESPKLSMKKYTELGSKKSTRETVKHTDTIRKGSLKGTENKQNVTATACTVSKVKVSSAIKNGTRQSISNQSRSSKSRSNTPTSAMSTSTSSNSSTSAVTSESANTNYKTNKALATSVVSNNSKQTCSDISMERKSSYSNSKQTDTCMSRSRSNTPGSSVSSASAASSKTNKSSSSKSSKGSISKTVSNAEKTLSSSSQNRPKTPASVKSNSIKEQTHSYMKTTQSTANRNINRSSKETDMRKQPNGTGTVRKTSGTKLEHSRPPSRSGITHSVTSGSSHEASPEAEMSISKTKSTSASIPMQKNNTKNSERCKSTVNCRSMILTKQQLEQTDKYVVSTGTSTGEKGSRKTVGVVQITQKHLPRDPKQPQRATTSNKPSSLSNHKTDLKSKPSRAANPSSNAMTSRKDIPGKRSTNRTESKNLMTDKPPDPKLVKSICLQSDGIDRSKRSRSKEPNARSTTPSSILTKSATTGKCSSASGSGPKTRGSGIKSRELKQSRPGTSVPPGPERKSKLIAPLTKNATNRLSKVSKRDIDVSSDVGLNGSKLKSLKSTGKTKSVESVSTERVMKDKSKTKKLPAKINKGSTKPKTTVGSDNTAKNGAEHKCKSSTGHKRDIKSDLLDMSNLSAENNEPLEKPKCDGIRSMDAQTCDLYSKTRTFSDSGDLSETGTQRECSPISQNYMEANNQCSLSEKMEFTEISCTDTVYITPGSTDVQNNAQNDSDNTTMKVAMETGSAAVLQCNEMQMHQHIVSERCEVMDLAVSEKCLAGRIHVQCSNDDPGLDCTDGYCFDECDHSLKNSVDMMDSDLDYKHEICCVEAKEDNSCDTVLLDDNSNNGKISLHGEIMASNGKTCQHIPCGENISPVCKTDAFYQTSEILSSTDSGFFTNEHSGQTSFISSASKSGDDEGLVMTQDPCDSYDSSHYPVTNCDNDQTTESDPLSIPCTASGTQVEASGDKIMLVDLEKSNFTEIAPMSQADKQRNIANILMNGVQDLNSNLRNVQNETGRLGLVADAEDKDSSCECRYPGSTDDHSPRDQRQNYEHIENLNTSLMCGDGPGDNNNKTQAPGQQSLNFETQVEGDQLLLEHTNLCENSDILEINEIKKMESNEHRDECETVSWQDKNQCDMGNNKVYRTEDLSVLQHLCEDSVCLETNSESVTSLEDAYSNQSSLNEIDENRNNKQLQNEKVIETLSDIPLDSNGFDTSDTTSVDTMTCTEGTFDECDNSEIDSFQNESTLNAETEMSNNRCNRLSLKEEITNALQLSPDIYDGEALCNYDNVSFTYEQRLNEKSDNLTSCDNSYCDQGISLLGADGLETVQIGLEENDLTVLPEGTGESTLRPPSSIDSTCYQPDTTRSLSPNRHASDEDIPLHITSPEQCPKLDSSENSAVSPEIVYENDNSGPQETENVANRKSGYLLEEEEIKRDNNCSQLPEKFSVNEQCSISENSQHAHESPIYGQEIISDSVSSSSSKGDQSNMKITPVTPSDPDVPIRTEHAISDQKGLNDLTDFQISTHDEIRTCFEQTDRPEAADIFSQDHTQGSSEEQNYEAILERNNRSTYSKNEYDFNTRMGDRNLPLKLPENTLHDGLSQHDVGDQIKNDSASINMNENLKGSQINDLSSYVDSTECSPVYLSAESARELGGSRDICFKQAGDSTSTGVIEINNHIMNQDFLEDQMSGLSAEEHTTQTSSRNLQVYSANFSEPQDFMLRDEQNQKCKDYERQLTPSDDFDTCSCGPEPYNKSQLYECRHDDGIESEIHINSGNYDGSEGILRNAEEKYRALCFESLQSEDLESLCDNCGLVQGAEVIREDTSATSLLNSVVNIYSEDIWDFEPSNGTDIQDILQNVKSKCSKVSKGSVLQDRECTADNVDPCKPFSGLDNDNTHIHLEDDSILKDNSIKRDNTESQPDSPVLCVSQDDFQSDSEKKLPDCLTQCQSFEIEDNLEFSPIDLNIHVPGNENLEEHTHLCKADCDNLCSNDVLQKERNGDKFRKSSLDGDILCLKTSELFKSNRGEQINVIQNENFESETESGESGSTESVSNITDVEFSSSCILANAGEALCESLSPTEVASILDDTSDSYVDATESLDYETDGELNTIQTSVLNKDKRISGDYNLYNVCESTSTESFQDAVETFDDGRHILIRSPDVTLRTTRLDDEDSLSQISLPLSDGSSGSSTSLENLTILGELSDGSGRGETDNEDMDSTRRHRVATFRSHTATRASLKHVQTSEYRTTKSVLKDNLYRGVANGPQQNDRLPQVGTNVLRSTDTGYESGNQIIKNVIYNTGNRIFHSKQYTQHQTGANFASSASHNRDKESGERNTEEQTVYHVDPECVSPDDGQAEPCLSQRDENDSFAQSCMDNDKLFESNESAEENLILSVSPTPRSSDTMNVSDSVKSPVDVNIGLKIETAMTIRTERRRLRRRQFQKQVNDEDSSTVKTMTERIMKSDTKYIGQECCADGFKLDNVVIYESPEIIFENSSHSTHESCTVCSADELSSCNVEIRDSSICKQSESHSTTDSQHLEENNIPKVDEPVSTVPPIVYEAPDETLERPIFKDEIIINEQGIIQKSQVTDGVCTEDVPDASLPAEVCSGVSVENAITENKDKKTEQNEGDAAEKERTYTFYIQSGNENDFDDIKFIDEEEHKEGNVSQNDSKMNVPDTNSTTIMKDQTKLGPTISSPNASFTIEYSGEEDNGVDQNETSEVQSEIPDQKCSKISPNIKGEMSSEECTIDTDENSCDIKEPEKINDDGVCNKDTVRIVQTQQGNNKAEKIGHQPALKDKYTSMQVNTDATESTDNKTTDLVSVVQDNDDESNSEIIEESHISVKAALQMEKQNLSHKHKPSTLRRSVSRNKTKQVEIDASVENKTVRKSKSGEMPKMDSVDRKPIKKSLSFRTEKEHQEELDDQLKTNKRVSDICRSFIDKVRPVPKTTDEKEKETNTCGRQRKLMKWVRANGKWLRIPMSETDDNDKEKEYENFAAELNTPTKVKSFVSADTACNIEEKLTNDNNDVSSTESDKDKFRENKLCDTEGECSIPDTVAECTESAGITFQTSPEVKIEQNFDDKEEKDAIQILETQNEDCVVENITDVDDKNIHDTEQIEDTSKVHPDSRSTLNIEETDKVSSIDIKDAATIENKTETKPPTTDNASETTDTESENIKVGPMDRIPDLQERYTKSDNVEDMPKMKQQQTVTSNLIENIDNIERTEHTDTSCENTSTAVEHELSENVSDARLQRQELLFGIRDSYNRRKHKKVRPDSNKETHASKEEDTKANENDSCSGDGEFGRITGDITAEKARGSPAIIVESPKAIPKLKAVKIKEEIFEGKPEYMKECNKEPSWSEADTNKDKKKHEKESVPIQRPESKLRLPAQLRKSKTFSGMGDFENRKREYLYMTIATSKQSLNASQESLNTSREQLHRKSESMESIAKTDETSSDSKDSKKDCTKNQGDTKIPWYSSKSRRSRDKGRSGSKDSVDATKVAEEPKSAATTNVKKRLKLPVFSRAKSLQRRKLLSEIVEVEENKDDSSPQVSHAKPSPTPSPASAGSRSNSHTHQPPTQARGNKRRSLSLPTGTLAFGEARIVYKNGHFTIETMDGTEIDSSRPPDPRLDKRYSQQEVSTMLVTSDSRESTLPNDSARDTTLAHKPHMKRQCAKTYLNRNDSSEDVFYNDDEEIENISPNAVVRGMQGRRQIKMGQQYRPSAQDSDADSSHISETSLECSLSDRMEIDTDSDRSVSEKSTSSLQSVSQNEDIIRETQRAKRTSSFRRAQQNSALQLTAKSIDIETTGTKSDSKERIESVEEENSEDQAQTQNQQNSTFLQKMMARRKSQNEGATVSNFSKQSESAKEFFAKKMTLKGLFKKNKSESSVSSPLKTQHPVSPPIAAFQGDGDIQSIDTPPGSPYIQHDLRRRHTSADIYIRTFAEAAESAESNCSTPTQEKQLEHAVSETSVKGSVSRSSLSSPSTPSHDASLASTASSSCALSCREEDQFSITSGSSATSSVYSLQSPAPPLEQPNKPKTPKPIGASPRRNPSYSSHLGRVGSVSSQRDAFNSVTSLDGETLLDGEDMGPECRCECEHRAATLAATLARQRKTSDISAKGSSDSLTTCPYCKQVSNYADSSGGSSLRKIRKRSTSSSRQRLGGDSSVFHRKDSSSRISSETLGIMSQTDVVSSNSNDSGIQRDVGVNSSNESIKGVPDDPVNLRRRKSSSPQPERPKSEVGVRWADLDATEYDDTEPTPIKTRQRDQNIKDRPRPKSDFEENIHLFDQLFEEVLEDFVTEGSSFLSDRMKAFGSEMNLQPYCSLRNLYEMRRRELDKHKNRRMSTPHPIKSRLQRVPRKQQKPMPLVRSSSMPESLEKIHKRRKLHDSFGTCPANQYFPLDTLSSHRWSDDSDLSLDNVSLQEKSISVQSSHSQLTSMDEEEDNLTYAEALWDHITMDPEELGFRAQDVIEVIDMTDKDWWFGAIDEREGWFPAAFVRLRVNQDQMEDDLDVTLQDNLTTSPKLRRISMFNKNQARTNVVNEIISAEREYVKHLKDVVEGYIQHARKRKEMFSDERILLIFGNIEDIYKFACKFLAQLEMCMDVCPHLSEIGQAFLDNDKGFEIYSDYCNNHPSACEELKELCKDSKYRHFFEACRLLQDLVEIPLEGFLLTPVQKICKYPLQLAELLKYTPPDHPDYEKVRDALAAMRKIATLINERKRKMESIEKIAVWQHSVVDWEGSDLLERSSELIFSGDLNKINTAGWSQERYFFLFDHQLIYCKKELLKRHVFSHKGRVDLDHCEIVDVPDGKDAQYNVTVKHAWKLHEHHKDKWYLLYAKSDAVKDRWLKAFADERHRVREDQENDFCMPDHWKQTVLNKVRTQSTMKDKQHSGRGVHLSSLTYQKDYKDFTYSTLPRRLHGNKQDKKKGWFIFGGGKKSKR